MTFNGTGNVVDGMINNWAEDGEPRQDLPEDAVQEFKVTNAGYKAEFGLATGGVVQVVTKSGTNNLRGTAFEYFRNKALNARGVFEAVKPDYRRDQFGGSVGGPILRGQGALLRVVRAHRHRRVLHRSHRAAAVLFGSLEGTFPLPSTREPLLGPRRLAVEPTHQSCVRPLPRRRTTRRPVRAAAASARRGRDEDVPRQSVVAGHTWLRGARQLNDFRFQYALRRVLRLPGRHRAVEGDRRVPAGARRRDRRVPTAFPSLTYGNNYDYISPESRWGFRDTYALNFGDHSIKFGGEYNYMPYVSESAGNSPSPAPTRSSRDQYFDPNDPGVDRGADRRRRRSARRRRTRPAIRRSTTSASSRTTGACCPTSP